MSHRNHLTAQQLRNFKRRARFTACGEPCDVFTEPWPYQYNLVFVYVNRNAETGESWLEATNYNKYEGRYTLELPAPYVSRCKKADQDTARRIISQELYQWASYPEGTITGWSPAEIAAEAQRIATA